MRKRKDEISKSELLTDNIWAYDTLEVSASTDAGFLLAAAVLHMAYEGCEYDFYKEGTYDMASDLTSMSGTWELIEDKTLLLDKGTDDEMSLEIIKITSNNASFKLHLEGDFFETPFSGDVTLKFIAK
ncbi:MAG: hypothetical protein JXR41_12545 [Bacteroidales bacterium]|nr:hypothetical protein [Bacteroidales bacterium]